MILGHEKAFLIQNMCPILPKYIKNEYIDGLSNIPVKLDGEFEKALIEQLLHKKEFEINEPQVGNFNTP